MNPKKKNLYGEIIIIIIIIIIVVVVVVVVILFVANISYIYRP